jgi:hypothetical protein
MAEIPKVFNQVRKGEITERKPFKNETGWYVGKVTIQKGKPFIVTAIVRQTPLRYSIYALPAEKAMDMKKFKDFQSRREAGQINIYIPGNRLFDVTVSVEN